MERSKLTKEISTEIAKSIDGVVLASVMEMDLSTFMKALKELNKVFRGKKPIKNFSITSPSVIIFISTFGNDKVIISKVDDFKGNAQEVREKIAEIINNKNPVYQIAKALQETDK
jgi:hypothetical protein